jgi:hypothetical protein
MARWPSLFLAAALMATPLALSARQPAPVEPSALAQAALACRGIPDEMAGAERRIVELGWPRVPRRNGEPSSVFERDGMVLMLMPPDREGRPLACGVMGTIRRSVSAAALNAAVSVAFGRQPGPGDAGGFPAWQLDGGQVAVVVPDGEGGVMFTFWYPRTAPH